MRHSPVFLQFEVTLLARDCRVDCSPSCPHEIKLPRLWPGGAAVDGPKADMDTVLRDVRFHMQIKIGVSTFFLLCVWPMPAGRYVIWVFADGN
jgi:hypothetical protein